MNGRQQRSWPFPPTSRISSPPSLTDLSGIGPATAGVITELVTTGRSTRHEEAQGSYPSSLVALGEVPGLSRKQILKLHDLAGITSVGDLKAACREGRLLSVPGIGPKLQAKLLDALGEYERGQGYHLYADVVEEAQELEAALKKRIGSRSVTLSGAMRRKMDVVNEFVFVVAVDGKMRMEGIA
jgi:DNA polymerase (family 10)